MQKLELVFSLARCETVIYITVVFVFCSVSFFGVTNLRESAGLTYHVSLKVLSLLLHDFISLKRICTRDSSSCQQGSVCFYMSSMLTL